jgi:signal transduction histidine kinase
MAKGTHPLPPLPPPEEYPRYIEELRRDIEVYQAKLDLLSGGWVHDFRNALSGVNGYATLLFDGILPPDKHPEAFRAIYRGGQQLIQLTNNLYDFVKIETGEMKVEAIPFTLRECLENVFQYSKERAEGSQIVFVGQIDPHVPEMVNGDRTRILRLFIILVDNAFRAVRLGVETGGVIDIQVTIGPVGRLHFSVRDNGIDIQPDNRRHLQDYFNQPGPVAMPYQPPMLEKRSGARRDWPLEMTLLKQLSDSVHGKLNITSTAGQTTFDCSLRYAETAPLTTPLPEPV